MKIEKLKIENFKAFRKVEMNDIPNFCVVVGENGVGKTTLFGVFGFLKEALNSNVETALNVLGGSRGFAEVRSRDSDGDITIELKFRAKKTGKGEGNPLITYSLSVGVGTGEFKDRAVVKKEILKYRRGSKGRPWEFLNFSEGKGEAITKDWSEIEHEQDSDREPRVLKSPDILAIKGLTQFERFPAAVALGDLIESWHVSDLHISQMRNEQEVRHAEHLSAKGENLSLVIDFLYKKHGDILDEIVKKFRDCIPGIAKVETKLIDTGQVLLNITDESFGDEPFLVRYVSDGTIKMLAYLVLLHDPNPRSLLCLEEPENQLYPHLLAELAEWFRMYALKGEQVLVSTHSPDFLNAIKLDEVFVLVKKNGYTTIKRARDNAHIKRYMDAGDKMGSLWRQGIFENMRNS